MAGPALTLVRDGGWVCWYTGAEGREGIHAVHWNKSGGTDGPVVALDDTLEDAAHPMLASMGTMTLAGMIARAGPARRVLALRGLAADREPSPWLLLGANARSGALAVEDPSNALAAWIEQSDAGPRLRLVQVRRR